MTFQTFEISVASGEPILLFDFSVGSAHFRYTTADRTIMYGGNAYAPRAIKRSNPQVGPDVRRQTLTVTAPRDIEVAQLYAVYAPSRDVLLTITNLHFTDPDGQGIVDWIGRVIGPTWKGSTVDIACEPVYTSVQATGLRRRWGVGCPHVLYGQGCTLNAHDFGIGTTLSAASGLTITIPSASLPTGLSFLGGFIEWDSGSNYWERRSIDAVADFDTTLTLSYGSPQLAPGLIVIVYPGCSKTTANCAAFGNTLNYGGQPFIPVVNPMDGTLANPYL